MEAGREDDASILRGGWRNAAADPIMRAAGIPIVYSFNESLPMWDAHRENSDGRECTHYCFPSAPEVRFWAGAACSTCTACLQPQHSARVAAQGRLAQLAPPSPTGPPVPCLPAGLGSTDVPRSP